MNASLSSPSDRHSHPYNLHILIYSALSVVTTLYESLDMSQYQPNAAPSRSFILKINLKFSNILLSSLSSEKDGKSDSDTLIHHAFVRYFDAHNEPYPPWLGEHSHSQQDIDASSSPYQPVSARYNLVSLAPVALSNYERNEPVRPSLAGYTRRSASRLQEMYNKSRQGSVGTGGSGLGTQSVQSSMAGLDLGHLGRGSSARLRERLINSSTDSGRFDSTRTYNSGSKSTWGRS